MMELTMKEAVDRYAELKAQIDNYKKEQDELMAYFEEKAEADLEDTKLKELRQKISCSFWEKYDDTHTVVRFATSWATPQSSIDTLKEIL